MWLWRDIFIFDAYLVVFAIIKVYVQPIKFELKLTLLFLPDLWIVSQISHKVGTSLVIIINDVYNNNTDDDNDDDDVPDGVAADYDDHDVDAHSGDQNLALSDQFLEERIWFYWNNCSTGVKLVSNIYHFLYLSP